jgi:hypothetical protein
MLQSYATQEAAYSQPPLFCLAYATLVAAAAANAAATILSIIINLTYFNI